MSFNRNFPSMTNLGWSTGSIQNQITNIHRSVCQASDDYNSDDPIQSYKDLLLIQNQVQIAMDMIGSKYRIDEDKLHNEVVTSMRDKVDEGIDISLWIGENEHRSY